MVYIILYNDHKNEGEDSRWGGGVLGQEAEEERMGGGSSKWVGSRRNRGEYYFCNQKKI